MWVAPIHEVGVVDIPCRTHLGHLLSAGDLVWGFHLESANCNDTNLDAMKSEDKPTVVRILGSFSGVEKYSWFSNINFSLFVCTKQPLNKGHLCIMANVLFPEGVRYRGFHFSAVFL